MSKFEDLFLGGSRICYAPAGDDTGGGAGGDDGAGDSGDSGDTGDTGDSGADSGGDTGGTDTGDQGGDEGEGDSKSKSHNLVDDLEDGEGIAFDFTTGEKPEGFPDEFWDEEGKAPNAQALFDAIQKGEKRINDLRAKMGKGDHKPPEKAEDYKLELSEELQSLVPDDDPLLAKARERAHAHNISQEDFQGFISDMIGDMSEVAQAIAENPPELTDEEKAEIRRVEHAKIGENATAVIRAVETWAKELQANGMFSEADVQAYKDMTTTGEGVRVLNKLRALSGGAEVPMDLTDDGLPSDEEIAAEIDKAYQSKDPKKISKAEELLDKRRAAGRPELLQIAG